MHILYYLLSSYGFIGLMIGLSTILSKKGIIGEEGSRKFIHIGVSNWYFIALIFMQDPSDILITLIPPVSFIVLNYISYKTNLIKSMERNGKGNLGTVYYPISLTILIFFSFYVLNNAYIGLLGVMIMGYGDGLAAVFGKKYGTKDIGHGKTVVGVVTMFIVSLIAGSLIIIYSNSLMRLWIALAVAVFATLTEYLTPKGLDNLSVPLGASFMYYLLLLI
ncbi:hypothetical protein IY230_04235 [Acholeplasma laidlawii]|uniref:diacylglycerol/polyprenol kinase family protein n=1 Tax=Acholeplasma laidlawii TaxID=2148 RepID=UPI0018C2802C|nr:hypothetical protein [Acholeplasma laidlawii]MBG0762817.1 hypothetical protein [Acholeplasma laidlawii]WIF88477.1 hypothetical protein QOL21_08565 [Acholeplasma laidlawii]